MKSEIYLKRKKLKLRYQKLKRQIFTVYEKINKISKKNCFSRPSVIIEFLRTQCDFEKEISYAICLDTKNRVIGINKLAEGTLTQCLMYSREIVRKVLESDAAAVVVIHNHPSGDVRPSENDIKVASKLAKALKGIDAPMVDFIIISPTESYSFYTEGRMGDL